MGLTGLNTVHTVHYSIMVCISLASHTIHIERKGLVQRRHCIRSELQKYCSPIRLQQPRVLIVRHTSKDGIGNWQRKLYKYVFTSDYRSLLFDPSLVSSLHQRQRRSLEVAMLQ